jgi:hypothetical protein
VDTGSVVNDGTIVYIPANGNKGKWQEEEDTKLVEAVKHGTSGSQLLVPVEQICSVVNDGQHEFGYNGTRVNGKRRGRKTSGGGKKHGKAWVAVALVHGRTNVQCR